VTVLTICWSTKADRTKRQAHTGPGGQHCWPWFSE